MFTLTRFHFLALFITVYGELKTFKKRDIMIPHGCPKLYIELVLSRSLDNNFYRIKVQWHYRSRNNGDWIGIYRTDPSGKVNLDPLEVIPVTKNYGWTETTLLEPIMIPENLGYKGRCLRYYAGYYDICHICLAVTCLRIEPDWMWSLRSVIGQKKIRELVFPGTHESAWYLRNFKNLSRYHKYITQRGRIIDQLIHGVRYIHMTVDYDMKNAYKWWVTHPYAKLCPLEEIFKDVRSFIQNTKEIVILDFKEFNTGFEDPKIHNNFIHYLDLTIGDMAAPNNLNWDSTFDKVWYEGRRLIIAYNLPLLKTAFMWTPITYKEFMARNMNELETFLERSLKRHPQTTWSAMANFFPNSTDLHITELYESRALLEETSFKITLWFRRKDWLKRANIIAVDYIESTGIVRSAIEWNSGRCYKHF